MRYSMFKDDLKITIEEVLKENKWRKSLYEKIN